MGGKTPLGLKIKELRTERGWTQKELGRRSGIVRESISAVEIGKSRKPSGETLIKLARAFGIRPEELYEAAGYIKNAKAAYQYKESPQEAIDRLKLALPKPVPFYEDYEPHATGLREPADYVYPISEISPSMEAYRIRGDCLEPHVKDRDIVVINRQAEVNNGDIAVVLVGGNIAVAQVRKVVGELWLENNRGRLPAEECQIIGVVTEVIRKLK
jgi:transcriptional regulator with XRE-family HTH domain